MYCEASSANSEYAWSINISRWDKIGLGMDGSEFYFNVICLIILYIFFITVRDRKLSHPCSWVFQILSITILVFFSSFLFLRSLGGEHQYGNVSCGTNGCINAEPFVLVFDSIQNILMSLLFPLLLFTTAAAFLMVLAEIPKLKTDRIGFDGAGIIFAGSLMFLNLLIGGYPALNFVSPIFLVLTLVLLVMCKRYRYVLGTVALSYLYPILYW